MHPKVFLCQMPFLHQPSPFPRLGIASEYAGWLAYPAAVLKRNEWLETVTKDPDAVDLTWDKVTGLVEDCDN